jgi:hypothetical protein
MLTKPTPFKEALESRAVKKLMPTAAGTAELSKLAPEIRERAMFSARVTNADFLQKADGLINNLVSPHAVQAAGGQAFNPIEARTQLKEYLASIDYQPDPANEGGLKDLSSDARLHVILDTNVKMAHGYGQFAQANDPDIIDAFPCQELYRLESRKEPRKWRQRWVAAGGKLSGTRMIARKDDPIWSAISRFGQPYPPFDFMSGMWTKDVSRKEAEELGVIKRSDVINPQTRNFNADTVAAAPDVSQGLLDAVLSAFGESIKLEAGKLILQAIA